MFLFWLLYSCSRSDRISWLKGLQENTIPSFTLTIRGGFRLTRLKLERQSKNSASTIFGQLVVNRFRNHNCTYRTATQTSFSITKPSVMQSAIGYAVSRCKVPFGQLLVDELSFGQKRFLDPPLTMIMYVILL